MILPLSTSELLGARGPVLASLAENEPGHTGASPWEATRMDRGWSAWYVPLHKAAQ